MLKQKIGDDLKDAMKKGNEAVRSTLRMLVSAVRNKEIELGKKDEGLSDAEVENVIASEVKRRKDAVEGFEKGGRQDLAENEKVEMEVLKRYLPPELPDDEIVQIIKDAIRETGAVSSEDFAKVMKVVMPAVKGRAPGEKVSLFVKEELGGHA